MVELLVVIAIISILAGMLLPALQRARTKAMTVSCVSNMKQIGLGYIQYANDYDDRIPPNAIVDPGGAGSVTYSWLMLIGPYCGYTKPSTEGRTDGLPDNNYIQATPGVLHCRVEPLPSGKTGIGNNSYPLRVGTTAGQYIRREGSSSEALQNFFIKSEKITHKGKRAAVGDSDDSFISLDSSGMPNVGNGNYAFYTQTTGGFLMRKGDPLRHGGREMNILFFDYHAGTVAAEKAYRHFYDPHEL